MKPLSPRQRECLRHVANGLTDDEVAQHMNVSSTTTKRHLLDIRIKLGARNRAHAVAIALREGIIA